MARPLRIGIYVTRFPVPSETFVVTKALGLLDAGLDVQIFAVEPSQHWDRFALLRNRPDVRQRVHIGPPLRPFWKALTVGGVGMVRAAVQHPRAFARFIRHNWQHRHETPAGFLKGIYTRLQFVGQRLDLLHVEFDTQALNVADLKDYLGCKLLLSSRGTFQKTSVLDQRPDAARVLYRCVDGYHFISEYLRANAILLGLDPATPTWLIEPAIDLSLFAPQPRPPRSPDAPIRLITVAGLVWPKGYEFALDAVARVRAAGIAVSYTIVGEGPYKEAIRFAARQLGLLDCVTFVGGVAREAVPGYLQESDVMLHAALAEGFCNAVIEGQAMALPVVCSDSGGLPENVEDGVTGFVVPRRDPDALADKLILLARDPDLRARMGSAGRDRAQTRFRLADQIQAFVALYDELAERAAADGSDR